MKHVPVKSNQITSIAYNDKTKDMEVVFKNGGTYTYHGVAKADHAALMKAESVGSHLHAKIKGAHKFSKKEVKK